MARFRVAFVQGAPRFGRPEENLERALSLAAGVAADLVVLPELALTGYPPLDLVERDGFVRDELRELDALAAASKQVAIAVGAVLPTERREGKKLQNAAVLLAGRTRGSTRSKRSGASWSATTTKRWRKISCSARASKASPSAPTGAMCRISAVPGA